MQGGENVLFQEFAKIQLEYGFVHPRPSAMPKNWAGFIIATLEGLEVDWALITADSLLIAIAAVADGKKKAWTGVAQWLDNSSTPSTDHQA